MKIPAVHLNRPLRVFWSTVEFISVVPLIALRVFVPLFPGYALVAERYVVDTTVSIAYFVDDIGFLHSRTAMLLLSFIPRNTLFIHLDSDYLEIARRRSLIVEPRDFIEFQREAYKIMESYVKAILINTSDAGIE